MKARKLSPSILSADFSRLGEEIKEVERSAVDEIHIDVMDGHFVPNISLGTPVIASLRKETKLFFDTHLMITNPARYFDAFLNAGADGITCHAETKEAEECIKMAKREGVRAGIAINPETSADALRPYLDRVDMVLIMTVHPGFGGQKFMKEVVPKIAALRKSIDKEGADTLIQVDGGINRETAGIALDAGAEILVAGSAVFHGDIKKNISDLRKIIETHKSIGTKLSHTENIVK